MRSLRAYRDVCWLLAGLLVASIAASVHAQEPESLRDAEARSLFDAGRSAMAEGRYEHSLDYFERAHALSGRPKMLYNIALVCERLHRNEKALDAYQRYLRETPEPERRVEVERRIDILKHELDRERALAEAAAAADTGSGVASQAAGPQRQPLAEPHATKSPSTHPASERADQPKRWWKSPWLWTAVGVVVVGISVGAGVAASSNQKVEQEPLDADLLIDEAGFRY